MTEISPISGSDPYSDPLYGSNDNQDDFYDYDSETTIDLVGSITNSLIVNSIGNNGSILDISDQLVSLDVISSSQSDLIYITENDNDLAIDILSGSILDPFFDSYDYFNSDDEPEEGVDILA